MQHTSAGPEITVGNRVITGIKLASSSSSSCNNWQARPALFKLIGN